MIRIATFENNDLVPFKTISQNNFDSLKSDCSVLKKNYTQFMVFKNLQLNLKDYFNFIEDWTKVPAAKMNFGISTNIHFVMNANKLILNTLMSFKLFIDNAEVFLKRKYGKDSKEAKGFILLTNNLFDTSFAYRFLNKLRNYSVHLGFPLEVVLFHIDFNSHSPEKSEHSAKLVLNTEKLLKEKKLFGAKIHNELQNQKGELDLIPLIREISHHIIELQKYIYSLQKEELTDSIENIEMFVGNHKTEQNQIKVYTIDENAEKQINLNMYDIPFDILNEYKTTYKNWR
ncbi:hypothetical protein EVU94_07395 [Flavobacteriaceae bacterium 144Ye]|nr:hypothetical protein EVU94_07395 [Flavobacteriaceae bacterium 144Ye]